MRYKITGEITAHLDKNGLSIFEGDIVAVELDNGKIIVGIVATDSKTNEQVIVPMDPAKCIENYNGEVIKLDAINTTKKVTLFNY